MKVAIVGGGISGLTCGWLLRHRYEVSLFEPEAQPGGHSHTVHAEFSGDRQCVDTGFIVCNDRTYPQFLTMLEILGVTPVPTEMSFSVRCDRSGLEYCGSSLRGLFAQKSNLLRPQFLKMIRDILRFNHRGLSDADDVPADMTVGEYCQQHGLGRGFTDHYLFPMGAAIWSCPTGVFRDFPIRFILQFYRNHGLLQLRDRPQWYTIPEGSRTYVDRLVSGWSERIRCGCGVRQVTRQANGVRIQTETTDEVFDEVVFACHSDTALSLLSDASPRERDVLTSFPYAVNDVVLHTDSSVLPRRRDAWAAWNYRIPAEDRSRPTVTYNMNILQHLHSPHTWCVTLNDTDAIAPDRIVSRHRYSHPVFSPGMHSVQARHEELIRSQRTSFCGAYWGNGFHEDGVASATRVCRAFGLAITDDWSENGSIPTEAVA